MHQEVSGLQSVKLRSGGTISGVAKATLKTEPEVLREIKLHSLENLKKSFHVGKLIVMSFINLVQ